MSTDRELTVLAAKAAGLWDFKEGCIDIPWSPLTDDGDALRLAVKLKIHIDLFDYSIDACYFCAQCDDWVTLNERYAHGVDNTATTRLAIVRAAASMAPQEKAE